MTWLIVLAALTAWLLVLLVTVALCRVAAIGDREDERRRARLAADARHQRRNQG